MTMSTTMTLSTTVTTTVESDPIGNLFKPSTTSGVANIVLLFIAVVSILIILFLALITFILKCKNNDILRIHVGNKTFKIPKNDVPLTDLLFKFNLIISCTAEHITLDDNAKRTIQELRLLINKWEIKEMQPKHDIDSPSQSLFDLLLPALKKLQINE